MDSAAKCPPPAPVDLDGSLEPSLPALSPAQKRFFVDNGYVVIRGVVPLDTIDAVRRAVNSRLGELLAEGSWTPNHNFPRVGKTDACFALVKNPSTMHVLEEFLGAGCVAMPPQGCVKLVFPRTSPAPASGTMPNDYWHVDGAGNAALADAGYTIEMGRRNRSRVGGQVGAFSLLAGVVLHDLVPPFVGSFTVWPGAHEAVHAVLRSSGVEGFCAKRPDLSAVTSPVELPIRRGDLILAHPLLPHAAAFNHSPDVRYAVYFRLRHACHEALRDEMLEEDMWCEMHGIDVETIRKSSKASSPIKV